MLRRWLPELLLALTSILLCFGALGLGEWLFRRANPDYLYQLHADESSNVYSETYGWELRKGFRGMDFGHLASINSQGFRGPEHRYEKTPGRTRVVMLGDSITYAAGVADDETFSALLESRGPQFEVVNLGVGGYGTDQELIKLELEGLRYHPDVVLLNFCLFSDFTDNALPSALFDARQPKPYFTWDGQALIKHDEHLKLSLLRRAAQWLSDYSYLYNRLRVAVAGAPQPREPGVWIDRMNAVMSNLPEAAEVTFRIIRRMDELTRQAGARFVVLVHPHKLAYRHRSRLMRKFCETSLLEGIPVIDLGDRYREQGLEFKEFAFDTPGHLNRRGNQIAAEAIARLLSEPVAATWDYRQSCQNGER